VRVHAAGSLRAVFTELGEGFRAQSGIAVRFEFGPSGLLRDRLAGGEASDVFASANMEHPRALHDKGMAGPVRPFARNRLCALVAPGLSVHPESLLERMLEPSVRLAAGTPKADPAGDYAWALFRKAEALSPGAYDRLAAKALTLTGGPNSPPPPKDRSQYAVLVEQGEAQIFLTYCTNALQARRENPALQMVQVPPALAVGADYGLAALASAGANARRFVDFVLSAGGQEVLLRHGFSAPGDEIGPAPRK
jgi:molybdenum ABC transporter molybdate-binding protein